MSANNKRFKEFFERIEQADGLDGCRSVVAAVDEPDFEDLSTQLYYMLILAMPEDSAGETILRNVVSGEGGMASHRLRKEYAPNEPGDVVCKMQKLMNTHFEAGVDLVAAMEKLDLDFNKYEKEANEVMSEYTKKGILPGALQNKPDMQKHIFRHMMRNLPTYLDVKSKLLSALSAQRSFDPDAMDISALKNPKAGYGKGKDGKGKGKGKDGKGKGKDKAGKDNASHPQKWCSYCEKGNHVRADCRKLKKDEQDNAVAKKKKDEKK